MIVMSNRTLHDIVGPNRVKSMALNPEFSRIFGRSLKPFFDNLYGFDVVKFDDLIKPEDGVSTADAVKAKYGDPGLLICQKLIGVKPLDEADIKVAYEWLPQEFVSRYAQGLMEVTA